MQQSGPMKNKSNVEEVHRDFVSLVTELALVQLLVQVFQMVDNAILLLSRYPLTLSIDVVTLCTLL